MKHTFEEQRDGLLIDLAESLAREDALKAENAKLRGRMKFLESLFERKWNSVVGSGSAFHWNLVGNYRHVVHRMAGETFAEAIDAAMKEAQS